MPGQRGLRPGIVHEGKGAMMPVERIRRQRGPPLAHRIDEERREIRRSLR
ncbi:hypothetical protein trd_1108 [Thermomicrobium roseum DSM 5159]|uniref:Uncharacterized protein n=1 Tax=Thermomicrobium roseum (strain ATCC 27502 / DSM 5159 / P-2) TaxID=309801 RepID=B9L0N7_THERP|nr:hypothetical protein trd_1108 [Thermomicrobium roseum DSM 5159]